MQFVKVLPLPLGAFEFPKAGERKVTALLQWRSFPLFYSGAQTAQIVALTTWENLCLLTVFMGLCKQFVMARH